MLLIVMEIILLKQQSVELSRVDHGVDSSTATTTYHTTVTDTIEGHNVTLD